MVQRMTSRVLRPFVLAASVIVASQALGAGQAVAARRSHTPAACTSKGTTILANESVRVFRGRVLEGGFSYYYCTPRTGKRYTLGSYVPDTGGGIRQVELAGRYVAYDYLLCSHAHCSGHVGLLDTRTRRLRTFEAEAVPSELGPAAARSLVVTAAGSVAWIRARSETPDYEVFAASPGRRAQLLDRGPAIKSDSLAAGGGTLYWTNDAAPRAAAIP